MLFLDDLSFSIDCFHGPLECLLALIQREEIDILDVTLMDLIPQWRKGGKEGQGPSFDAGAEFIFTVSLLAYLKSRKLLPAEKVADALHGDLSIEEPFDLKLLQNIVEYRKLRHEADKLAALELEQQSYYYRGASDDMDYRPLGIEQISLETLEGLFNDLLAKAKHSFGTVLEEEWRVGDKVIEIEQKVTSTHEPLSFEELFADASSKNEMVVLFLALLELIKNGKIAVSFDQQDIARIILLTPRDTHE